LLFIYIFSTTGEQIFPKLAAPKKKRTKLIKLSFKEKQISLEGIKVINNLKHLIIKNPQK